MKTPSVNPVEKKLSRFRKILGFCFGAISFASVGMCATYWIFMINSRFVAELIFPTVFLLTALGIIGAVCLGIYHLIKNNLEKDEEPFL
jgi:H+/Cl- antiporter ClcA